MDKPSADEIVHEVAVSSASSSFEESEGEMTSQGDFEKATINTNDSWVLNIDC